MKAPLFKAGQFVVLPAHLSFPKCPQVESERLYTVAYHIWNGQQWFVALKELGALAALAEHPFRAATKKEINAPF